MPAVNEKRGVGLTLAILGVLAMYAAFAPSAKATEVTPADTTVNFSLAPGASSDFKPTNAYADSGFRCTSSGGTFHIPDEPNNKNQPVEGPQSNGHGSVIADLAMEFTNCSQFNFETGNSGFSMTLTTDGNWTTAAHASPHRDPMLAVGVPPSGISYVISIPLLPNCNVMVSPEKTSSIIAEYWNPEVKEGFDNGMIDLDGQVTYTQSGTCTGSSPLQLEAIYEPDVAVTVTP